jgi:hypothetical protein
MKAGIVIAVATMAQVLPSSEFPTRPGPAGATATGKRSDSNGQSARPISPPGAAAPRLASTGDQLGQPPRFGNPVITLREKRESVRRERHGAANVYEGGKIAIKAVGNKLSATLTGTANAYAYILCHSYAGALLHLEQEFDVNSGDQQHGWTLLTMTLNLDGHLRTDKHGGASLRVASASIRPAGGGEAVRLAIAPRSAGGVRGAWRVNDEAKSGPVAMPAGRFLLIADFVVEATADHISKGHGEVDFAPDSPEGSWAWSDPIEKVDSNDFGLTVNVKAENP